MEICSWRVHDRSPRHRLLGVVASSSEVGSLAADSQVVDSRVVGSHSPAVGDDGLVARVVGSHNLVVGAEEEGSHRLAEEGSCNHSHNHPEVGVPMMDMLGDRRLWDEARGHRHRWGEGGPWQRMPWTDVSRCERPAPIPNEIDRKSVV